MTREEAIHFAECLKHNWTIDFNDMEDFCDMAIEALSAEAISKAAETQQGGVETDQRGDSGIHGGHVG